MPSAENPRVPDQDLSLFSTTWRRRSLLRGSLMLAGAASVGLMVGCQPAATNASPAAPTLMRVLNRLKPVLLPDLAPLVPVTSVSVDANISKLFALMDPQILKDLDSAASLFEFGSTVLGWHFAKFTSLNDTDAIEYIDRWQNGVNLQRGIVTVFKKLIYASYWRDPSTWVPLGFDGPVAEKWGLPSLGNAPLPADVTTSSTFNSNAREAV